MRQLIPILCLCATFAHAEANDAYPMGIRRPAQTLQIPDVVQAYQAVEDECMLRSEIATGALFSRLAGRTKKYAQSAIVDHITDEYPGVVNIPRLAQVANDVIAVVWSNVQYYGKVPVERSGAGVAQMSELFYNDCKSNSMEVAQGPFILKYGKVVFE